MKVRVELDRCVGGGQCVLAAPDVFDQRDEDGLVILLQASPPTELHDAVREAAHACPALAIELLEE
ncbi:ferredoxin [Dactylosporangium sp. NPDC005572]|uniref:ferredoxin n=1 Tax=Dactylosporangium sp. NPDC005572 TaxID=3156889 RepID=UPI0033BA133A